MPSTYTDSLGLELQANGENLSTWGTKANTVFSLLEEAVSGYVAVTISGDTTLTITDGTASSGATDQARNGFIKLTGTPGAGFALTLPEVEKPWLLWNDTDGAATVKTATATATVVLPVDQMVIVQSDGAGSVLQVTPFFTDTGKIPVGQIENMGATTVSTTQWGYVGGADQPVKTTDAVEFAGITSTDDVDIDGAITASGAASLAGLVYPTTDGAAGQYVTTDGAGNLSFGTPAGGGDVLAAANGSDFADIPTVRTNLGLGTAATKNTGTTNGTVPLIGAGDKLPESILPESTPGGLVPIGSKQTLSSVAATDISLSGGYDEYIIKFWGFEPATTGSALLLRTSSDGGTTFDSGAADYNWAYARGQSGQSSVLGNNGGGGDAQYLVAGNTSTTGCISDVGYGASGHVRILQPAESSATALSSEAHYFNNTSVSSHSRNGGFRLALSNVDSVRLFFSSGNIASGEYQVYGVTTV